MDATRRWETEALRTSSSRRPKPSNSRRGGTSQTTWVTLKEAEAATGIPTNTLRKWVRKDTIPSFLEHDGDFALRMVDLDAVRKRAKHLGRRVEPTDGTRSSESETRAPAGDELHVELKEETSSTEPEGVKVDTEASILESRAATPEVAEPAESDSEPVEDAPSSGLQAPSTVPTPESKPDVPASQFPEDPPAPELPPDTMLVPVDAWNKMLAQLGNLHEAGQQLADARERAAKAETEAEFLRERLSELRDAEPGIRSPESDSESDPADPDMPVTSVADSPSVSPPEKPETTTYWRYLTTGWRDRKRKT